VLELPEFHSQLLRPARSVRDQDYSLGSIDCLDASELNGRETCLASLRILPPRAQGCIGSSRRAGARSPRPSPAGPRGAPAAQTQGPARRGRCAACWGPAGWSRRGSGRRRACPRARTAQQLGGELDAAAAIRQHPQVPGDGRQSVAAGAAMAGVLTGQVVGGCRRQPSARTGRTAAR
jgi:hypothetical protein